jgi:glycosyltransferase involved in cell wall biosynthesis
MKLNIQVAVPRIAVSFREVASKITRCFNSLGHKATLTDAEKLYLPNIKIGLPLEFITWDVYIFVCTVASNAVDWFTLYSQPLYSKKAYYYGVVEGICLCPEEKLDKLHNKLVVPSNFCKTELEKFGIRNIKVIPHGIDPDEFKVDPNEVKAYRSRFPEGVFLYHLATGDTRKGIDLLLQAIKIVNQKYKVYIQLDLYRIFEEKYRLMRDKLRLENRVFITPLFGEMTRREIAVKMNASDNIYVFPSTCEGLGLPLLENMSVGKAPIICDAPPMNEIVTEKEGYKIPYVYIEYERHKNWMIFKHHKYEPQDLANQIIYAIEHPKETEEKGIKARERAITKYHHLNVYREFLTL